MSKNATIAIADAVSNGAKKQFSETSANQRRLNPLPKLLQNGDRQEIGLFAMQNI